MSDLATSFDARVDRTGEHHLWIGATDPVRGTGRLKVAGKNVTAHRVAWELAYGTLPTGAKVLACPDAPACVRVEHLLCDRGAQRRRRRAKKGDGSVRQVRRGTWQLSVTAEGANGRRRVHSTVRASNRAQAVEALAAFAEDVRQAAPVPEPEVYAQTVDEALEVFLTEHLLGEKGREERTVSDYRRLHLKWFSPTIGRRLVRDVDEAAVDEVFGRMRAAGMSRSRMNQAKSLYKPFFRWAKRRGLARRNPMADFELPTSTQVPVERTPPEVEEMCTLLATAVEVVPDIAPILALGAVTGMRRGELVSVRRSRLDPVQSRVTVDVAAWGRTLKHTKTRRVRTFHVDDATMTMLIDLGEKQAQTARSAGLLLDPDPFLFTTEPDASKPLAPDALTKRVGVLKEYLGIEDKRPETIVREDQALALYRSPAQPRPKGRTGPSSKGGMTFAEIGRSLGRSERWAALAVASAERREAAAAAGRQFAFDGSILALRKFTSSELLDAGFNIAMVAARQGHSTQVLAKHYAKSRPSADKRAAAHLGQVVYGSSKVTA